MKSSFLSRACTPVARYWQPASYWHFDMVKLIIIAFIVVILYNLGAGLYYMMVDKGTTDRTVRSLTWRIGLSVALIVLVILGIWTGVIQPHDVNN